MVGRLFSLTQDAASWIDTIRLPGPSKQIGTNNVRTRILHQFDV